MTPVGKTKDQGWEIGVQRTLPTDASKLWLLLVTQPGLGYWLGHDVKLTFNKGDTFKTKEGITGEIRSYSEGSLIRMRWQPPEWDFASTLQLRVAPGKKGAKLSIHHEKLENGEQREQMRRHWMEVVDKLKALIEKD